ncbi:hypothetical protein OQA88_10483 [Cercophora sp. LCS_1]
MDPGQPDPKRPRLSTVPPWSAGGAHHGHGVSLPHPTPSTTGSHIPHHPPPASQYPPQPSPHSYPPPRPAGPGDPHHQHQPPPPPHHHQQPQAHPPPPHAQQPPLNDDRRHHEPERYPPMQEHRPPQSPAHPPYPGYPSRDPMVKPDPGEDTLPQLRRPLSTGGGPDSMTPGTPHAPHPPPQTYPEEKRHVGYDSGPPPSMYRQPSYPPQTPHPHSQPYDYAPSFGSHSELPYTVHIASSGKRKAQRASQACDSCRQLKAKCDETKPCKSCREKKVECKYREAVPKQQDKVATDILDALLNLTQKFSTFEQRFSHLEHVVKRVAPTIDLQPPDMKMEEDERPGSADSGALAEDNYSSSPGETLATNMAPINAQEARTVVRNMEDETEADPGPQVKPGVPAIPPNHTTLAALLLKWPAIDALVRRHLEAENVKFVDEFPIRQEERRGLLRIWGRGEGDSSRGDKDTGHELGVMEVQDEYSDTGAPSPADCWGQISGSPGPSDGRSAITSTPPLDFQEATVWKYVKSYEENVQNMHPLMIPVELHAMVKLFLESLQSKTSKHVAVAKFAAPYEHDRKRKRTSPAPEGQDLPSPKAKPTFQRSINNALVLLVLALGKICDYKKKIPDLVPVGEPSSTFDSPSTRNGYPASPSQGSPPGPPSYSGHGSPKDGDRSSSSRRQSFQGVGPNAPKAQSLKRNMDVIPGLDYFAHATDILGGQLAGSSLRHIHAYLLAGLYHGQLGRVVESYAYIKEAGYALQIKMRPAMNRLSNLKDAIPNGLETITEKTDNQLCFAFWTCLQLESDIIAELPLPQSHILAFEEMIPYPNIKLAEQQGHDGRVLRGYLAQLYLRKSLNHIHSRLYDPEKPDPLQYQHDAGKFVDYVQNSLDMRFVPPEFKFNHNDPPAKDILAARLRAKYWGAQVITYRPFIRQILDYNHKMRTQSPNAPEFGSPAAAGAMPPNNNPNEVINNAEKGIRALIESTRAFHGIKEERFVITNVFGTAHAQWGNLLTLAAAFKDPTLHPFVDEPTLRDLFQKTISFFRVISQPSSALAIDMRILEGLDRELWRRPMSDMMDLQPHPNSSFSSTTSGPPPQMPPQLPPMNTHPPGAAVPPGVASPYGMPGPHPMSGHHGLPGSGLPSPPGAPGAPGMPSPPGPHNPHAMPGVHAISGPPASGHGPSISGMMSGPPPGVPSPPGMSGSPGMPSPHALSGPPGMSAPGPSIDGMITTLPPMQHHH